MSPRPKRRRKMSEPPFVSGFMPEGGDFNPDEVVVMHFEEYEAMKLADYEHLTQLQASKRLGVSRPTFTRIYDQARKKIALAFVENKRIVIQGGEVEFDENWYRCGNCGSVFKLDKSTGDRLKCPVCQSRSLTPLQHDVEVRNTEQGRGRGFGRHGRTGSGPQGFCICPHCDFKIKHQPGVPCNSLLCPHCNIRMIKEDSEHYQSILKKRKK